jgi:Asp-tRNA(Asn)/Glu-tRNA(Gln) amidotransferase A subunit family amidase
MDDAMRSALRVAETALRGAGATVANLRLPPRFGELDACFRIINGWETSIALAAEIRDQGRDFNAFNRSKLDFIASLSIDRYKAALEELRAAQFEMDRLMAPHDILVAPSAPGEALPYSVEVVPDECAKLWSLLQMPAINIPLTIGPDRLPLGLQLIGKRNNDDGLLATARWIDRRLRNSLTAP